MKLIELITKESAGQRGSIFAAVSISGIANASILAIINSASKTASYESINFQFLMLFLIAMALYVLCLRYTFDRTTVIFETMIERIRNRLSDKIRHSELTALEGIGRSQIYNRLTQETTVMSESQGLLTAALQAVIMVVFTSIYIALLSGYAFLITMMLVVGGVALYLYKDKETTFYIQQSSDREVALFESVTHILDGFKEVKMSQSRSDDLFDATQTISREVRDLKIRTMRLYNSNYIFSQCFFYILIGAIIFILPRLVPTYTNVITEVTTAILFIVGPLSTVVSAFPALAKSNIAAENIAHLEHLLDESDSDSSDRPPSITLNGSFREIALEDVEFSYIDREKNELFSVGPLSLTIPSGEILFVVGGNGSGKSTMIKLLTALYYPSQGRVRIDNVVINRHISQAYRELFCIIFSDFHLFDRLYGLPDIDPQVVADLLVQMGIQDKTAFLNNRFTNLDLSTGQRKRLAMLVTLLEDLPIYVFDEWAADQDPEFRRYFYEVLLKDLKARGKTVIAVTHDDHYFHVADRVIKMNYGQIETL